MSIARLETFPRETDAWLRSAGRVFRTFPDQDFTNHRCPSCSMPSEVQCEFVRGSLIDQLTNVFGLGRLALVLLGDRAGTPGSWPGPAAALEVLLRATSPDRDARHPNVAAFVAEYRRHVDLLEHQRLFWLFWNRSSSQVASAQARMSSAFIGSGRTSSSLPPR
jgi:hypothetical protein